MNKSIFSLLRFLENQNEDDMDKTWLPQEGEKDAYYKCFENFLNYDGNLKNFIEKESESSGYTAAYLRKIASQKNWKNRKKAFVNYQKKVNFSGDVDDLELQRNFQKIELIKATSIEIYTSMIRYLDNKIDKGQEVIPEGDAIEIINFSSSIYGKIRNLKQKLVYKYDAECSENSFRNILPAFDVSIIDED